MGMDLIPSKKGIKSFSFNWSGWAGLREYLSDDLTLDLSEMDGLNEGKPIKAATLRSWGKMLEFRYGKHQEPCPACLEKVDTFTGWPGGFKGKLRCFAAWCQKAGRVRQW